MTEPPLQNSSLFPQALSVASAIRSLRRVKFTSAKGAVEALATWQDSSRILQLYRRYFPQEFGRSTAGTAIPQQGSESGYSEREIEFMGLVDRRLFPLPEMLYDAERLPSIPIYPQGVDWEDEPENLRLSLRATMALVSDDDGLAWENWLPKHLRPAPGERDWNKFERMCRKTKGLATRIPILFSLVSHDTGNVFLDTTWEYSWEEYPWEERAMEYLIKEWREAQHIFAQIDALLDRIDKHPRYWLTRIVMLWNRAIKVTPRFKSDQRSATTLEATER